MKLKLKTELFKLLNNKIDIFKMKLWFFYELLAIFNPFFVVCHFHELFVACHIYLFLNSNIKIIFSTEN